jgi:hypothetical protein
MSVSARWTAVLVALTATGACSPRTQRVDVRDPSVQSRMAVMALLREDFASARPALLELAGRCQAGEHGRRAVLLLAAAELDTGNEAGSPHTALQLSRSYLLLPNAPREEVVLARSLYRLAADLGGLEETVPTADSLEPGPYVAPRFDGCDSTPELTFRPLPETSSETLVDRERALVDRERALETSLAARSDSLATLRDSLSTSQQRVTELESELARITQLLTSGAERHSANLRP